MTSDKETIFAALWARLTSSVTGTAAASRRMRFPAETPEQPAMFMEQVSADTDGETGMPGKQTVEAAVVFYATNPEDPGPMPAINGFVSQAEAALKRKSDDPPGSKTTTLGGMVAKARITRVEYGTSNENTNQGIAKLTVLMLTVA